MSAGRCPAAQSAHDSRKASCEESSPRPWSGCDRSANRGPVQIQWLKLFTVVTDAPRTTAPEAVLSRVPRILIVDDEPAVVVTVQGVLELDGYDITATTSAEEALELIRSQHFD